MESTASHIFVDSCQYTPVYFLEDPSITQAKSYVVTQNTPNLQEPVSDNLKRFYENSGKLENNLNVSETNNKPRILKKCANVVGNNLKLASFLMPKPEPSSKHMTVQANNVLLKPVYIANTPNIVNNVPKLDINSKIVQLKEMPNITRTINAKIVPKIKAKETTSNSKHTSVQLIKLGETYHSLNQLSEEQMKIVNHALKIFSNPKEPPQKPTYDPVTNKKFIYNVVSPKDLTFVGKNELLLKQKKAELVVGKKDLLIKQKIPELLVQKSDVLITQKKPELKKIVKKIERKEPVKTVKIPLEASVKIPIFLENAVTRSGRKVRISKSFLPEEKTSKEKKKTQYIASCHHCTAKFNSVYRLQRHYEFHPTHSPDRLHSNLFQCMLAIVKNGTKENSVNIFLNQLEEFISKLRSCVPCLIEADNDHNDGQNSIINDNVSRLLGISPGKYKVNIDGLECEKNKNGYCEHNPPQHHCEKLTMRINEPNEVCKEIGKSEINEMVKLPIKRVEPRRYFSDQNTNAKKLKINPSDDASSIIDDDIVALLRPLKTEIITETDTKGVGKCDEQQVNNETKMFEHPKAIQFRSSHFDIRSSPIKPSANTFNKFQINTENMSKYKVHIIRPLQLSQMSNEVVADNTNMLPAQQLHIENVEGRDFSSLEQLNGMIPKDWSNKTNDLIKTNSVSEEQLNGMIPKNWSNETNELIKTNSVSEEQLNGMIPKNWSNETNELIKTNSVSEEQLNGMIPKNWSNETNELIKINSVSEEQLNGIIQKNWSNETNELIKTNSVSDTRDVIQPMLMQFVENSNSERTQTYQNNEMVIPDQILTDQEQSIDALNFLESLGNECIYPETEIRNNPVDFHLDLFSFNT